MMRDLLGDEAGPHVWVISVIFIADDPPRPDDLRARLLQRLLLRDRDPDPVVELRQFVVDGLGHPFRR